MKCNITLKAPHKIFYNCTNIHFHSLQAHGEITQGQGLYLEVINYMGCHFNMYVFQKQCTYIQTFLILGM